MAQCGLEFVSPGVELGSPNSGMYGVFDSFAAVPNVVPPC